MTNRDWFLFSFTFFVGAVAGMYLYVTSFKPVYAPEADLSPSEEAAQEFSVTGHAYGGHVMDTYQHPTFRVVNDGTYTYVPGGTIEDNREPVSGTLPRVLFSDLKRAATRADLEALSYSEQKDFCNTYVDGFDYTYTIVVEKEQFALDTCASALDYDDTLALVLDDVWMYLEDPSSYSGVPRTEPTTPSSYIQSFLRGYFSPDSDTESNDNSFPEDNGNGDVAEPLACPMDAKICPDGTAVGRVAPSCTFAPCPGE